MTALALGWPGPFELVVIAVVALLVFGRRLPEVGRSLGRSITQFKQGLKDVEDQIKAEPDQQQSLPPGQSNTPSDHDQPTN